VQPQKLQISGYTRNNLQHVTCNLQHKLISSLGDNTQQIFLKTSAGAQAMKAEKI
jgi:hypothetical protein